MAKIIIIASIGLNNELGIDNKLIWSFKEDLLFFKETTLNHKIIMGYNTYLSLPTKLKFREYIVLTHHVIDNILTFADFYELISFLDKVDEDVYVIGGAQIYNLFIDIADELILTHVKQRMLNADTYFPDFNNDVYIQTLLYQNTNYRRIRYQKY